MLALFVVMAPWLSGRSPLGSVTVSISYVPAPGLHLRLHVHVSTRLPVAEQDPQHLSTSEPDSIPWRHVFVTLDPMRNIQDRGQSAAKVPIRVHLNDRGRLPAEKFYRSDHAGYPLLDINLLQEYEDIMLFPAHRDATFLRRFRYGGGLPE